MEIIISGICLNLSINYEYSLIIESLNNLGIHYEYSFVIECRYLIICIFYIQIHDFLKKFKIQVIMMYTIIFCCIFMNPIPCSKSPHSE